MPILAHMAARLSSAWRAAVAACIAKVKSDGIPGASAASDVRVVALIIERWFHIRPVHHVLNPGVRALVVDNH